MSYTDSYGPDSDGDPVQSRNGGDILPVTIVCQDDSNGPSTTADTPSIGQTAPTGPCA